MRKLLGFSLALLLPFWSREAQGQTYATQPVVQVTQCCADVCSSFTCTNPSVSCATMSGCFTGSLDTTCPHNNAQSIYVDERGYTLSSMTGYYYMDSYIGKNLVAIKLTFSYFDTAQGLADKEYLLGSTTGSTNSDVRTFTEEIVGFDIQFREAPDLNRFWLEDALGTQQVIGRTNQSSTSSITALSGRFIGLTAKYYDNEGNGYPTSSIGEVGIIVDSSTGECELQGMFIDTTPDPITWMQIDVGTGATVTQTQTVIKSYQFETCSHPYTVSMSPSQSWLTLSQPTSTELQLDITSTDLSLIGTNILTILTLTPDNVDSNGLPASIVYRFQTVFECATTLSFPTEIADVTYFVDQGPLQTGVFSTQQTPNCGYTETLSFSSSPDASAFLTFDSAAQIFTIDSSDPADVALYTITVTVEVTAEPAGVQTATFDFIIDLRCVVNAISWSPEIAPAHSHTIQVDPVPFQLPFAIVQDPLCAAALSFSLTGAEPWIQIVADTTVDLTANDLNLFSGQYLFSLDVSEPISGLSKSSPLEVTLINYCEFALLYATEFETQVLYAWEEHLSLTVPFDPFEDDAFTLHGLDCGAFAYNIEVTGLFPAFPDPVTHKAVDQHSHSINIAFDESRIFSQGLYVNLALTGTISDYHLREHTEPLTVKVYAFSCNAEQLSYNYKVGENALQIVFDLEQGPDVDISRLFQIKALRDDGSQEVLSDTSFLTLVSSSNSQTSQSVTVQVLTTEMEDAGLYQVGFQTLFGQFGDAERDCLVPLEIEEFVNPFLGIQQEDIEEEVAINGPAPPRFAPSSTKRQGISELEIGEDASGTQYIKPVSVSCEDEWSGAIPYFEGESDENVFSVSVDLTTADAFLKYSQQSRIFESETGQTNSKTGIYSVTITGTSPNLVSMSFELRIHYSCEDESASEGTQGPISGATENLLNTKLLLKEKFANIEAEAPKVEIKDITPSGLIKLHFTNSMITPQPSEKTQSRRLDEENDESKTEMDPLKVLKMEKMVKLELVEKDPDLDGDIADKSFDWNIVSYSEHLMSLSLVFNNPLSISQNAGSESDKIKITFVDTTLIFDIFGQELEKGTWVERDIPPQYANEAEAEVFTSLEETFEPVSTGYFSSDFTVNALIAGTLNMIWSLVLSQQIVILMPLFHISLPANTSVVMQIFFSIVSYEMIPTDVFWDDMAARLVSESPKMTNTLEKYQNLGLESVWLLPNFDSLLLFMVLAPLKFVVMLLIIVASICCKSLLPYRAVIENDLLWNWPINFFKETYIVLVICCVINIKYGQWSTFDADLNMSLSYVFLLFAAIYPLVLYSFLSKRQADLLKIDRSRKYRSAFFGLRVRDMKSLYEIIFFYYRRLVMPLALIACPDIFILQYAVLTLSGTCMVIFLGYTWPYSSNRVNKIEFLNEIVIIFIMYHILCFTDFMPHLNIRHYLGYSVIVCILLNLVIFYAVWSFFKVRELISKMRKMKAIKNGKKLYEQEKARRQEKAPTRKSWKQRQDAWKAAEKAKELKQLHQIPEATDSQEASVSQDELNEYLGSPGMNQSQNEGAQGSDFGSSLIQSIASNISLNHDQKSILEAPAAGISDQSDGEVIPLTKVEQRKLNKISLNLRMPANSMQNFEVNFNATAHQTQLKITPIDHQGLSQDQAAFDMFKKSKENEAMSLSLLIDEQYEALGLDAEKMQKSKNFDNDDDLLEDITDEKFIPMKYPFESYGQRTAKVVPYDLSGSYGGGGFLGEETKAGTRIPSMAPNSSSVLSPSNSRVSRRQPIIVSNFGFNSDLALPRNHAMQSRQKMSEQIQHDQFLLSFKTIREKKSQEN